MGTWYLLFRTHLNWPGFLEILSFLQPTTVSSEIKYEYLWIKGTKFITSHHQTPSTIKSRLLTSLCLNRANDRVKFDYWGLWLFDYWNLLLFCLYDVMIWIFENSYVGVTDKKSCSYWPDKALAKSWS